MKIKCHCGEVIFDQTDSVPHKGHLIPDQTWFGLYDAIDAEVISPLAEGRLQEEDASRKAREIIMRSARLMYQCRWCGCLYIDDLEDNLQCFAPASEATTHWALRGRAS